MLESIRGEVVGVYGSSIVVSVDGVGICLRMHTHLKGINVGQSISLYSQLLIKENSWTIYAFPTEEERDFFNLLLSVQGVGGKVAIALMSLCSLNDLLYAIINGDAKMLSKADGIGLRIATRIVSELKCKVEKIFHGNNCVIGAKESLFSKDHDNPYVLDVVSALCNLGYTRAIALEAVNSASNGVESFEDLFKKSLTLLAN